MNTRDKNKRTILGNMNLDSKYKIITIKPNEKTISFM